MNKAITEGLQLMPPAFEAGLGVWSRGDGTPGSDTYAGAADAALVTGDSDFGSCLELQKTESTQRLRFMGQTPIEPGCYLQIRVRLKAMSGALPTVRVAGFAATSAGDALSGVVTTGAGVTLSAYGRVEEVTAIVGVGTRGGVDMPWGLDAEYGHFGLDLSGPSGGVVRIEDIEIRDVTSVFVRDMLSLVDVRDFGALGDGSTDDHAAFEAADDAADGRRILVPAGTYRINDTLSLAHEVIFEGRLSMPTDAILLLTKDFSFPPYAAAFDSEEEAFKKAFQALINNVDHATLDLGGRMIAVTAPIDMQAAVPNRTSYATRRIIRNGQFNAQAGSAWDTEVVTQRATYSASNNRSLTNVQNISSVQVGARVSGAGVGREIYVKSKNTATSEITLSAPLYDAEGTQNFTFTLNKYMLDFTGFSSMEKFGISGVEFQCNGEASAVKLPPAGKVFVFDDCFFTKPKDRAITSIGTGCQGMLVDNCQFLSDEDPLDVSDRTSIAINVNGNDVKLRHNRATRFRHWAILSGQNHTITGNHFFQGDSVAAGVRSAGIVLTQTFCSTTISDNYIDNCFVEWSNEYDATPDFDAGFSFSALSVANNVFLSGDVAPWFSYLVIRPYGTGHFLNGLSVVGNKFRSLGDNIDRAERVDTSFAALDFNRTRDVFFEGNTFHNVSANVMNPLRINHDQSSKSATWRIGTDNRLPFQGWARGVDAVMGKNAIRNTSGAAVYHMPYADTEQGTGRDEIDLKWPEAVDGEVTLTIRMDR
ncbi:Pectate lyase superfamily protein [Tritonibacter multivorans]|uniref:Pectate lyase superfamily protein n=1 Tax=Tritonibacter multivorans TaxID=928856 RepID=A0A0P1GN26_9RHOB|nr:right-handed parallel beta-helix repeat-containing protein [Tritonibacter multivorans]MDA7422819.1 right-handed parallel beta-helix repeat-containing protein [Tritonibacter multivorans]CUH77284.1 Pectate lyase superfamily protein [Tritonibacter multivorans]SFD58826.1 Pectate lyase superfamily protein [Tritonibacter multivorans]